MSTFATARSDQLRQPAGIAYARFLESILPACLPPRLEIRGESVRHLDTGGENFVFRATSEIHGEVSIRVPSNISPHLREAPPEHRALRSQREFRYLQLAALSDATVPKPIAQGTLSNESCGHSFLVCSWLEGRQWSPRTDNTGRFWTSLADQLSKLHRLELECSYASPWNESTSRHWPTFVSSLLGPWLPERALREGAITKSEADKIRLKLFDLTKVEGPTTLNHGDLHPQNLLVAADGTCAGLIDLGLVRILNGPWEDLARLRVTLREAAESDPLGASPSDAFEEGYSARDHEAARWVVDAFELGHLCGFLTWDTTVPDSPQYLRAQRRIKELCG